MKIICAVDGSSCSRHAIQSLAHLAPPEELVLVHALNLPDFNYAMITPDLRAEVQTDMEAKLRKEGEGILIQAKEELPADFSRVQEIHQIGHPPLAGGDNKPLSPIAEALAISSFSSAPKRLA